MNSTPIAHTLSLLYPQRLSFPHQKLTLIVTWVLFFALGVLSTVAQGATAQDRQSLEEIHQLVLQYLKQKVDQNISEAKFEIRPLSKRLRLQACQTPLELDDRQPNKNVGRMTIGVSCNSPTWKIYVPASISGKVPVIYTNNAIIKGQTIEKEDIRSDLISHNQLPHGAIIKKDSVLGMRTKRSIRADSIIRVQYLEPPYWVFKNRQVTLITRIGNIEVKSYGICQKDGVKGEQVPVINSNSNKTVRGIVVAPNTVLIP